MAGRNLDIMIIHKDPLFTARLEKFLYQNVDCTILSFETLRYCLNSRPPQPEVVFIDYHLDDMDGLRTAGLLKKRWKRAIFVLIGSSERLTQLRAARFGVDILVSSEESPDAVIRDVLRLYRYKRLARRIFFWLTILLSIIVLGFIINAKA